MKTFYIEAYFREDIKIKRLDDIPILDDYIQKTKTLKIIALNKDEMTSKVLKEYENVAYISVLEVIEKEIQ